MAGKQTNSAKKEKKPASTKKEAAPAASAAAPAQKSQGLFAQMAATAGGVAVGSAVGNAVGSWFGGSSKSSSSSWSNVCEQEWKKLTECLKSTSELTGCQDLHDLFKKCSAKQ